MLFIRVQVGLLAVKMSIIQCFKHTQNKTSGLTRGRARHENLTVIGKKNVVGTIDTFAYVGYVKEGDIRHLEGSRRNLKHVIRL